MEICYGGVPTERILSEQVFKLLENLRGEKKKYGNKIEIFTRKKSYC